MSSYNGTTIKKVNYNGQKVKKWNHNGVRVYTAGSTVTYNVDNGRSYVEEVDSELSCLSPKTFTPAKDGWTFVGWREDTTANSTVLTSKVMADAPVTLYAVFTQNVTVTYYDNTTTAKTSTKARYYNNGTIANPSFALSQASRSGWTARGWSTGTTGDAAITYNNGATFTRDSNITLYGMYQTTVTVTYYNNSATASTTSGTRYYNSNGQVKNPSFTLTQAASSGWTARGWSTTNSGSAGITYNNGATFTRDSNITLYGLYQQTITLYYNGNSATSGSVAADSKTRYWAPAGYINPTFTLKANGFTRTNHTFSKWALNGPTGTQYAVGATVTLTANATVYAVWTMVEFIWIQNGVAASGYTLILTNTDTWNWNCNSNYTGKTSVAEITAVPNDSDQNHKIQVYTNYVNTQGATKMTITTGNCAGGQNAIELNNYGTSNSGEWAGDGDGGFNGKWSAEKTFTVTPNSNVRLCMSIGGWATNGNATMRITQVRFHN